MSKRSGGVDIQTNRTSQRGVYFGAWSAYIPGEEQIYQASVRRDQAVAVLRARRQRLRRSSCRPQFPMAVHLLEGHWSAAMRQRQIIGQREKLLALGTITAGLTHQLNNPAAATARAVADLRETRRQDAPQAGDAGRRQVQPRGAARAGQHPGRGRRAGRQVQVASN